MELANAGALVTGGSSGIGRETARALVERGAEVVICARGREELRETASEIGAVPVQADVSSAEDAGRAVRTAVEELDRYDVLINNAGVGAHAPLVETGEEEMRRVWETNVLGATLMARESARHFTDRDRGNIVNIGSTAGRSGYAGGSAYASTKFALRGLSECWRSELRSSNVRVFHVDPSEVQTAFGRSGEPDEEELDPTRLRPEEIAHAIVGALEMDDRGFIPDLAVWATNPR